MVEKNPARLILSNKVAKSVNLLYQIMGMLPEDAELVHVGECDFGNSKLFIFISSYFPPVPEGYSEPMILVRVKSTIVNPALISISGETLTTTVERYKDIVEVLEVTGIGDMKYVFEKTI
jgi:hypothetical protein